MAVLAGRFVVEDTVRETASSQVLACRDLVNGFGNELVAVKMVRPELGVLGTQEFQMLQGLCADDTQGCIVHAKGVFTENNRTCIVMELLGDSLHDRARQAHRVDLGTFVQIARDILTAVKYVHDKGVIHADIKPGNFAFVPNTHGRIKLIDFGNAMSFEHTYLYYDDFNVQTTRYRAPECVFGIPFGSKIDIWSSAVTLLELALGKSLFTASNNRDLISEWRVFFGRVDPAPFVTGKFYSSNSNSQKRRVPCSPTDPSKSLQQDSRGRATRLRPHGSAEYHHPGGIKTTVRMQQTARRRASVTGTEQVRGIIHAVGRRPAPFNAQRASLQHSPSFNEAHEIDCDADHDMPTSTPSLASLGSLGSPRFAFGPGSSNAQCELPDAALNSNPDVDMEGSSATVHPNITGLSTFNAAASTLELDEAASMHKPDVSNLSYRGARLTTQGAMSQMKVETQPFLATPPPLTAAPPSQYYDTDSPLSQPACIGRLQDLTEFESSPGATSHLPTSNPNFTFTAGYQDISKGLNGKPRVAAFEPFELARTRSEITQLLRANGSEIAFSEECVDLLARMLIFDPERRLSADEALIHPALNRFEMEQ